MENPTTNPAILIGLAGLFYFEGEKMDLESMKARALEIVAWAQDKMTRSTVIERVISDKTDIPKVSDCKAFGHYVDGLIDGIQIAAQPSRKTISWEYDFVPTAEEMAILAERREAIKQNEKLTKVGQLKYKRVMPSFKRGKAIWRSYTPDAFLINGDKIILVSQKERVWWPVPLNDRIAEKLEGKPIVPACQIEGLPQ